MTAASLLDRAAVARPETALSVGQRACLQHAAFYRHHRETHKGDWYLGPRWFQRKTVQALAKEGLVRREKNPGQGKGYHLELTLAGRIVYDKLENPDA